MALSSLDPLRYTFLVFVIFNEPSSKLDVFLDGYISFRLIKMFLKSAIRENNFFVVSDI